MGQILHGNARTTYAVKKDIQSASEEVTDHDLAKRLNKHVDTIRKWRNRDSVADVRSHFLYFAPILLKIYHTDSLRFRSGQDQISS